jgi:spore cortex biosynthesis protein YabQ
VANVSNGVQLAAFLRMFASGAAIGFLYDLCAVLLRDKDGRRALSDTVFWIACGAVCIAAFFYANRFELRLYLVLGLLSGWFVYFLLLGSLMRALMAPLHTLTVLIGELFHSVFSKIKKSLKPMLVFPKSMKTQYTRYKKYVFSRKTNEKNKNSKEKE